MTTGVDVDSVRKASDGARRWRIVVDATDGTSYCRIATVPLLTKFIRQRRTAGDNRPLKPVLSWLISMAIDHGTLLTDGDIESILVYESGKKKESTNA
jgi:hypothetical protein